MNFITQTTKINFSNYSEENAVTEDCTGMLKEGRNGEGFLNQKWGGEEKITNCFLENAMFDPRFQGCLGNKLRRDVRQGKSLSTH